MARYPTHNKEGIGNVLIPYGTQLFDVDTLEFTQWEDKLNFAENYPDEALASDWITFRFLNSLGFDVDAPTTPEQKPLHYTELRDKKLRKQKADKNRVTSRPFKNKPKYSVRYDKKTKSRKTTPNNYYVEYVPIPVEQPQMGLKEYVTLFWVCAFIGLLAMIILVIVAAEVNSRHTPMPVADRPAIKKNEDGNEVAIDRPLEITPTPTLVVEAPKKKRAVQPSPPPDKLATPSPSPTFITEQMALQMESAKALEKYHKALKKGDEKEIPKAGKEYFELIKKITVKKVDKDVKAMKDSGADDN